MWMERRLSLFTLALLLVESESFGSPFREAEEYPEYWNSRARKTLQDTLKRLEVNNNPAKNVILFIGDGMDIATMTAGRILKGQREGHSGEEKVTAIDKLPHVGLSKVYTINSQSPDSAGTATAIMTGVKTKSKLLGVNGKATFANCESTKGNELRTILEESAALGKSTGVVTTTHVLHATPASTYAHSASRGWTTDSDLPPEAKHHGCKDIGSQLIEQGRKINVILGGGRVYMRPKGHKDEEYGANENGKLGRSDGRNLIEEWLALEPSDAAAYVWNRRDFRKALVEDTDYLLGLFEKRDMKFSHEKDDDIGGEPSLAQMTAKAIKILQKNEKGFFLLVEGGKIDHGHHETKANVALNEFVSFDEAVERATILTNESDTLIVVTADHGHVFTHGGYSVRGNPVNGFAEDNDNPMKAKDGLPFTSIAYGNGAEWMGKGQNKRKALTTSLLENPNFSFPSAIPLGMETHSSTDVGVFARGPMAHLFGGVYEQNYIGYAMMYASCVGADRRHCNDREGYKSWECPKLDETDRGNSAIKKSLIINSTLTKTEEKEQTGPWWCFNDAVEEWNLPTKEPELIEDEEVISESEKPTTTTTRNTRPTRMTRSPRTSSSKKLGRNKNPTAAARRNRGTTSATVIRNKKIANKKVTKPKTNRMRTKATTTGIHPTKSSTEMSVAPTTVRIESSTSESTNPITEESSGSEPTSTVRTRRVTTEIENDYRNVRSTTARQIKRGTTAVIGKARRTKMTGTKKPNNKPGRSGNRIRPGLMRLEPYLKQGLKKRRRPVTPTAHRILRRDITTESEYSSRITEAEFVSNEPSSKLSADKEERTDHGKPTTRGSNDLGTTTVDHHIERSRVSKHPRDRMLDQISQVIRNELSTLTVYSGDLSPATLELAVKVAPVHIIEDSMTSELGSATGQSDPVVVCMQWSSDKGIVALDSNSTKVSFIYPKIETSFEKLESKDVATAGSNNTAIVLLSLLTVTFFILSVVLFYHFWKRSEMLRNEIEERERERKAAILARMQLQDIDESDRVYVGDDPNMNNNSCAKMLSPGTRKSKINSVSQWCNDAYETRRVRKSRKISCISS